MDKEAVSIEMAIGAFHRGEHTITIRVRTSRDSDLSSHQIALLVAAVATSVKLTPPRPGLEPSLPRVATIGDRVTDVLIEHVGATLAAEHRDLLARAEIKVRVSALYDLIAAAVAPC